ncbi:hypothetical protein IT6_04930 [Methylacidiphilum caldifontis]|uniref:hypothetical protein n=1 Tax=Methylacidiphilum caldifontis TaxID=2795386 RepID=UPI001A8EA4F4|nr:hypothetical protein [Methylacidiphilum caldifontis]QSR89611.1 hypothetical protein IT6_04930 [Methylacidiphilum caldifontis]
MKKFALLLFLLLALGLNLGAQTSETEELDKAIEQAQKQLEKQQRGGKEELNQAAINKAPSLEYSPKNGKLVSAQDFSSYIKKHKTKNLWVYGHFKVVQIKKNNQLVAKPIVKGFIPLINSLALPKVRFVFLNPQNLKNSSHLYPGDSFYVSPRHPALVTRVIYKNREETIARALFSNQPMNHLLSSKNK